MTTERQDAYLELFQKHWRLIRNVIARRMTGRESEIEDAIQDVFLKAHKTFDPDRAAEFCGWISVIANRHALDLRRKHGDIARKGRPQPRWQLVNADELDECADAGPNPFKALQDKELLAAVEAALEGMRERDAQVFRMHVLDGSPCGEVMAALGLKNGMFWKIRHRVRRKLAERLADRFSPEAGRTSA